MRNSEATEIGSGTGRVHKNPWMPHFYTEDYASVYLSLLSG